MYGEAGLILNGGKRGDCLHNPWSCPGALALSKMKQTGLPGNVCMEKFLERSEIKELQKKTLLYTLE